MLQAFNVLRYEIGQKYNSHCDAFDPAQYGPQKSQRVCLLQKNAASIFLNMVFSLTNFHDNGKVNYYRQGSETPYFTSVQPIIKLAELSTVL